MIQNASKMELEIRACHVMTHVDIPIEIIQDFCVGEHTFQFGVLSHTDELDIVSTFRGIITRESHNATDFSTGTLTRGILIHQEGTTNHVLNRKDGK